jgi:hypothetical protein
MPPPPPLEVICNAVVLRVAMILTCRKLMPSCHATLGCFVETRHPRTPTGFHPYGTQMHVIHLIPIDEVRFPRSRLSMALSVSVWPCLVKLSEEHWMRHRKALWDGGGRSLPWSVQAGTLLVLSVETCAHARGRLNLQEWLNRSILSCLALL